MKTSTMERDGVKFHFEFDDDYKLRKVVTKFSFKSTLKFDQEGNTISRESSHSSDILNKVYEMIKETEEFAKGEIEEGE